MGELSENAISRLNNAKDLWCEVIASHSGGKHAFYGEEVEYTVFVRNIGSIPKDVTINIQGNITDKTVLPDEIVSVSFLAKADSSQEVKMRGPKVTVNNLEIYVPEILVGNPIDNTIFAPFIVLILDWGRWIILPLIYGGLLFYSWKRKDNIALFAVKIKGST